MQCPGRDPVPAGRGVVRRTKSTEYLQCVFRIPLPHTGAIAKIPPLCGVPVIKRATGCQKQKEVFLCPFYQKNRSRNR